MNHIYTLLMGKNWMIINEKLIKTFTNLSTHLHTCIVEYNNVWLWFLQPQQKIEGQNNANEPCWISKYISDVWKLDDSQWKVDKNIPKLGKWSIYMCDWVIESLDLVKADRTKNWGSNHKKNNHMWLSTTLFVNEN